MKHPSDTPSVRGLNPGTTYGPGNDASAKNKPNGRDPGPYKTSRHHQKL